MVNLLASKPWRLAVSGSSAAKRSSISIAITSFADSNIARVSEPKPGPISSATSSGPTSALLTILRQVFASTTKFCPSFLVGRTPIRSAISRISAAPSKLRI